ncbi:MAG TPA: hypothetical protein VN436_10600, partial [Holophaga sp.]|nr:hypothetical protein [Holophaga sp.]
MPDACSAVTLPDKNPPPHDVHQKTLPCYVILVHGVNDVGETYPPQERGLCLGLAERLGRNYDLKPYEYRIPQRDDPLQPLPDRIFFHRVEGSGSHSPVIPFYWGFREENRKIKKDVKSAHGEWLDACNNRIDKDGAKGGGPFQNACNCLPHMWVGGWKPGLQARAANTQSTPTHRLNHAAPDRRYQVLAALRLAMLIRIIRKRHPQVAINVVAHSMGCLVALLAQAFLLDEGARTADCLVLNNAPYSFDENRMDNNLFQEINQTSRARIETFKKIVKAFHDKRAQHPEWSSIQQSTDGDLAWKLWTKGKKKHPHSGHPHDHAEWDNRGRIHLYFSPHDRTVALLNTQGIGWQGIPDHYRSEWREDAIPGGDRDAGGGPRALFDYSKPRAVSWNTLLADLEASGFRQRLFMRQNRNGETYQ